MSSFDGKGRLRNQRHEKFCQRFVHGHPEFRPDLPPGEGPPDTRNNATQSYIHAGFNPGSHQNARHGGWRLLQREDVRTRISSLRDEEDRLEQMRLRHWRALVPEVQQLLLDAVRGTRDVSPTQIQAAKLILDQALGPTQLRFRTERSEDDLGLYVTVYGGRHEVD